jgi:hypothetical protein
MTPLYLSLLPTRFLAPSMVAYERKLLRAYFTYCWGTTLPPIDNLTMLEFVGEQAKVYSKHHIRMLSNAIRRLLIGEGLPDPILDPALRAQLHALQNSAKGVRAIPGLDRPLHRMLDALPRSLKGIRDAAVLNLIYHARFSARQITALCREDVAFTDTGGATIRTQDREGATYIQTLKHCKKHEYCAVAALREWWTRALPGLLFPKMLGTSEQLGETGVYEIVDNAMRLAGIKEPGARVRSLILNLIDTATGRDVDDDRIRRTLHYKRMHSVKTWQERAGYAEEEVSAALEL